MAGNRPQSRQQEIDLLLHFTSSFHFPPTDVITPCLHVPPIAVISSPSIISRQQMLLLLKFYFLPTPVITSSIFFSSQQLLLPPVRFSTHSCYYVSYCYFPPAAVAASLNVIYLSSNIPTALDRSCHRFLYSRLLLIHLHQ